MAARSQSDDNQSVALSPDQPGLFAALEDEGAKRQAFFNALHQRNEGLLPGELSNRSIVVIGAGSVGSGMAETLTRAGVGRFILIDPDQVEAHNLTRSVYRACDVGTAKVRALEAILKAINPWVRIEAHASRFEDVVRSQLKAAVEAADLIICAADDKLTQAKINRISVHHKKPLVMAGVYAGAKGGEVALVVPGITPCLECTLAGRRFDQSRSGDLERATDYGTGRLKPTVGLGCDIHIVTTAASKLSLSLMSAMTGGSEREDGGSLVLGALQRRESLVIFGMTPEFWFLPDAMGNAAGQYAFQSVWLQPEANANCGVCGSTPGGTDPIDEMQSAPSAETLRLSHAAS